EAAELFSPLPGLSLRYAPAVAQVNEGSPARKALERNDLIEGMVDAQGQLRPLASARAFYETIAQTQPGQKVNLQLRGRGRVPVVVGQGSDERKPLFSLFVAAGNPAQADWVGWSPIGPYEASSRPAERHIGWHFNTGDPARPADFALADQYRKP